MRMPASTKKVRGKGLTLRDVAHHAGVSPMTVSNVVNGRFGAMAQDTRERVEEAIRHLNYRPNLQARELRLSRSFMIGIVIIDPSTRFLAAPFTTQLVSGLSNYLSEHGYRLAIQGIKPEQFKNALVLQTAGTDGLCVLMSGSQEQREHFQQILATVGQPIVVFQEFSKLPKGDFCRICQEDFEGGHMLARHVIGKGAKRLVMLEVVQEWPAFSERIRGVRAAVAESGDEIVLDMIACGSSSMTDVELGLRRYLSVHPVPDAVLGANDQLGLGAMQFLRSQNLRIPDDVMITGFNAFGFQQYATIPLTTIRSPAYDMGVRGGAEMLARLNENRFSQSEVSLPVAFEPGGSA